jgi:hypothetical protein
MGGLPYLLPLPRIWDQVALLKTDYIQYLLHLKGNFCTPCEYDARTNMLSPMKGLTRFFRSALTVHIGHWQLSFYHQELDLDSSRQDLDRVLSMQNLNTVYSRIEGLQLTRSGSLATTMYITFCIHTCQHIQMCFSCQIYPLVYEFRVKYSSYHYMESCNQYFSAAIKMGFSCKYTISVLVQLPPHRILLPIFFYCHKIGFKL